MHSLHSCFDIVKQCILSFNFALEILPLLLKEKFPLFCSSSFSIAKHPLACHVIHGRISRHCDLVSRSSCMPWCQCHGAPTWRRCDQCLTLALTPPVPVRSAKIPLKIGVVSLVIRLVALDLHHNKRFQEGKNCCGSGVHLDCVPVCCHICVMATVFLY